MGKTVRAQEDLNLRPLDPQSNALSTELWARESERVGFEPTVPAKAQLLSREPDSATLAPLHCQQTVVDSPACTLATHRRTVTLYL